MNKMLIPALFFCVTAVAQSNKSITIYFNFNKDQPSEESVETFKKWMLNNQDKTILVLEGDADKTGNEYYNIDLSERRINSVYKLLQQNGGNLNFSGAERKPFGEKRAKLGHSAPDRKVTVYYSERLPEKNAPIIIEEKKETSEFAKTISNSKIGDKIRIPNLYFLNNSDIFVPESTPVLRELLQAMQNNRNLVIDLQGHICCQKNEENEISKKRAVAVYNFLVRNGIERSRLTYHSFGSTQPVYPLPEKNEDERNANRRVEIEILEN